MTQDDYREKQQLPQKTMTFEMESTDIATAIQFYLNEKVFKVPVFVVSVKQLSVPSSTFRIEFLQPPEST